MRRVVGMLICALASSLVAFHPAAAQTSPPRSFASSVYKTVSPGKTEVVSAHVRDSRGRPIAGIRGTAVVQIGSRKFSYAVPSTRDDGTTRLSFNVPSRVKAGKGTVRMVFKRGHTSIAVSTRFYVAAPGGQATLILSTHVLPAIATPPAPVWILVYARTGSGVIVPDLAVNTAVAFKHKTLHLHGVTGTDGVATFMVDTSHSTITQTVAIGVVAYQGNTSASSTSEFSLTPRAATPTPTATATAQPTDTPTPTTPPTQEPTATDTPVPTDTSTPVPADTDIPAPTATPTLSVTDTPVPTPTDTPTLTSTATATATATPTSTPTATPTPVPPTATPTPAACAGTDCLTYMVTLLNEDRASYGQAPLSLDMLQSTGNGTCPGAYGHSQDMAAQHAIYHNDILSEFCQSHNWLAQNVGYWPSNGDVASALLHMEEMMMSEGPDSGYPAVTPGCEGSHACNIISPNYSHVGVGIYVDSAGTVWLTQDFWG